MIDLQAKWDGIYKNRFSVPESAEVLEKHLALLPTYGKALDLACGFGHNAMLLAEQGLTVDAWDISGVALAQLDAEARKRRLTVMTRQCLINEALLKNNRYDVIVVSRFLDRSLCNAIMAALKPAGLLFYQTFIRNKPDTSGPSSPEYLLESNELLRLFAPLNVLYYQEYDRVGELTFGNRNEACFIGLKT